MASTVQQFGEARIQRYQPFPCDLDCLIADPLDAFNAVVSILSPRSTLTSMGPNICSSCDGFAGFDFSSCSRALPRSCRSPGPRVLWTSS